jgi:hypothetical protein
MERSVLGLQGTLLAYFLGFGAHEHDAAILLHHICILEGGLADCGRRGGWWASIYLFLY